MLCSMSFIPTIECSIIYTMIMHDFRRQMHRQHSPKFEIDIMTWLIWRNLWWNYTKCLLIWHCWSKVKVCLGWHDVRSYYTYSFHDCYLTVPMIPVVYSVTFFCLFYKYSHIPRHPYVLLRLWHDLSYIFFFPSSFLGTLVETDFFFFYLTFFLFSRRNDW